MDSVYQVLETALGLGEEPRDLTFLQVSLRAVFIFLTAIPIIRFADKRFFAKATAFDIVLSFILAAMLARAVNGSAPFFPTIGAAFVLIGLHRLLAKLALHSDWLGTLVKGNNSVLIRNGKILDTQLRKHSISQKDLEEQVRLNGNLDSLDQVKEARLERSGDISVIPPQK